MAGESADWPGADTLSAKLRVRLTPSGGADRIDGVARDADGKLYLKARVRAPPEHGEANAALEKLVAKALGVAKSRVCVERGASARMKTVAITDAGAADVAALLERYAEQT